MKKSLLFLIALFLFSCEDTLFETVTGTDFDEKICITIGNWRNIEASIKTFALADTITSAYIRGHNWTFTVYDFDPSLQCSGTERGIGHLHEDGTPEDQLVEKQYCLCR